MASSLPEPDKGGLSPSAITTFIKSSLSSNTSTKPSSSPHAPHLHNLALQVLHNLQYQHDWTELHIHTHYSPSTQSSSSIQVPLPRPLITGLPPQRIYIHPDEQIELLQREKDRAVNGLKRPNGPNGLGVDDDDPAMKPEIEWVLPTHLREKWSLKRFADVFDAIKTFDDDDGVAGRGNGDVVDDGDGAPLAEDQARFRSSEKGGGPQKDTDQKVLSMKKERNTKRLLLATVSDDSTVVYYIVHDGIVKPRQN